MIAPNLNKIIKLHLEDEGYRNIEIYPLNAYGDSKAPFITWAEFSTSKDVEKFWMTQSIITYSIFDNDASRAKDIAISLQKFLNVGDDVQFLREDMISPEPEYRLCWCRFYNGGMFPPLEREGYVSITRSFEVGYIDI